MQMQRRKATQWHVEQTRRPPFTLYFMVMPKDGFATTGYPWRVISGKLVSPLEVPT